jgi:hypothetical protein
MNLIHELTQEQVDNYYNDETRASIRNEAAAKATVNDTVSIVSPDGEVWDTLAGSLPDDGAIVLTDEQLQERREQEAKDAEHIQYLETQIRPQVMGRLRAQARGEVREQLREKSEEINSLRADVARAKLKHQADLRKLSDANLKLRQEIATLRKDTDRPPSPDTTVNPSGEAAANGGSP